MMSLATHRVQGSYAVPRPLSSKKRTESENTLVTFPIVERIDTTILLKQRSSFYVKAPLSYRKTLKVSSYKSNVHSDKSVDEKATGSLTIQQLFKSWLTLLREPSLQSHIQDRTLDEGPSSNEMEKTDHKIQSSRGSVILRAVWRGFLGLDLAIKMPAIIFIPMYLAVNLKYGSQVTTELTPLWTYGPLVVAMYIKIVQWLSILYVYSFKQSGNMVNNLPSYFDYVRSGKLKESINASLWVPVVSFRHLGYKGIWKHIQEWIVDKYLDYIESIWPHYCKFIRFMKRANFI